MATSINTTSFKVPPSSAIGHIVNPLANPKGVKLNCELCGKPAYLQCKKCRLTYYCDEEHQEIDFNGIHDKICQLIIPLRTPVTFGSEEERANGLKATRQRQLKLLEVTKIEAHKKLFESKYDLAIPAALQALRFSMDIYGQAGIELVPSYLLLGEASVGLKQFSQAEDYLSLAKWAVLKADESVCTPSIKSQLHRNLGILYASKGEYDQALEQLAHDIFYSSLDQGPDHISASGGYFQLGNVFLKQNRHEDVTAVFDKVVSIWRTSIKQLGDTLDEAQQAEAIQILTTILDYRTAEMNKEKATDVEQEDQTKLPKAASSTSIAEVLFILAQVYQFIQQLDLAKTNGEKAFALYEAALGKDHSYTLESKTFLKNLNAEINKQR